MKIKAITPRYSTVITTANKVTEDVLLPNGLIDTSIPVGSLHLEQTVISTGTFVKDLNPGDIVKINPRDYLIRQYKENTIKKDIMENQVINVEFPTIVINEEECLFLKDSDIEYIITDFE